MTINTNHVSDTFTPSTGTLTVANPIAIGLGNSTLGSGNASTLKNRIINGAMVIAQRSTGSVSASTTSAITYGSCDRWAYLVSQASKFTYQQSSTAPSGFTNSLLATSSSAYTVGSTETFNILQVIEGFNCADLGFGTANAKTVTISFWVQSSLTGTFGAVLCNYNINRTYPFTYSIPVANTWTQISVTIPGDTTGTWYTNNSGGLQLMFSLGTGTSNSGTAGSWSSNGYYGATGATSVVGTNGATFYITGVQLEVGSSATGFEYRQYGTELALCQRYLPAFNANNATYSFSGAAVAGSGFAPNANGFTGIFVHPVATRVPPTGVVVSANADFTVNLAGSGQTGTFTFAYSSTTASSINITQTSRTSGQGGYFYGNVSTALFYLTGCEL